MQQTLMVIGGSGFVGLEICRAALEAGRRVIALSRRGRPALDDAWAAEVEWIAGDALQPETWRGYLRECQAVIHCVGIIREQPEAGMTFERINSESVVLAARAARAAGVEGFVFLSALIKPPLVGAGYLSAKRAAEAELLRSQLRAVVLRPGLIYGPRRPITVVPGLALRGLAWLPGLRPLLTALPVALVARAAVRAASDPAVRGLVDIAGIERLARG